MSCLSQNLPFKGNEPVDGDTTIVWGDEAPTVTSISPLYSLCITTEGRRRRHGQIYITAKHRHPCRSPVDRSCRQIGHDM